MNSVALPTSASTPALRVEADLVRRASGGDAESFGELYRRHSQAAWRLAQAAAGDTEDAVQAVGNGFASALRPRRGLRKPGGNEGGFRPLLLAAVYQAAAGHGGIPASGSAPISPRTKGSRGKAAEAALFEAAFRSLPERWRGAVWLSEVEDMDAESIAAILGVSIPVATQLTTRGRRGLEGRFAQSRRRAPAHLGSALRPLADVVPPSLASAAEARWLERDRLDFGAIGPWLSERAVRPLWAAVGGLMGLALIGLGIVGQSAVLSTASGLGPGSSAKTLPVGSSSVLCFVNCPLHTGPYSASDGLAFLSGGSNGGAAASGTNQTANPGVSGAGGTSVSPAGSVGGAPSSPAASTGPSTGPGPSGSSGSGSSGGLGSGSSGGSGTGSSGGSGGSGTQQQSKTVVDVAPVATVTQTGNSVNANVLPTGGGGSSSSAASVTVGCSTLIGITIGSITLGCPASSSTPTTTDATPSTTSTSTTTTPTTTTTLPLLGVVTKLLSGL